MAGTVLNVYMAGANDFCFDLLLGLPGKSLHTRLGMLNFLSCVAGQRHSDDGYRGLCFAEALKAYFNSSTEGKQKINSVNV